MTKLNRPEWHKGSPHPYGLLAMEDVAFWERVLDHVAFKFGEVRLIEIGVQGAATMMGTYERCQEKAVPFRWIGVDLPGAEPKIELPPNCEFIFGRSEEVYVQPLFKGFNANLLFIDGDHSSNGVCLDFCDYHRFVRQRGLVVFHDASPHPDWVGLAHPGSYQGHGPQHAEFGIGVRFALEKLGLSTHQRRDFAIWGRQHDSVAQGMEVYEKL